jgi:hypothetical protein
MHHVNRCYPAFDSACVRKWARPSTASCPQGCTMEAGMHTILGIHTACQFVTSALEDGLQM